MVKQSRVALFGSKQDPEVLKSAAKIKKAGRKVENTFTSHPDGTGPCGRICSCQEFCKESGAFLGDHGAMMGQSY
jgi:hypothetical protein